jgi:hypothetical protein
LLHLTLQLRFLHPRLRVGGGLLSVGGLPDDVDVVLRLVLL